jgi:hypothetical protein
MGCGSLSLPFTFLYTISSRDELLEYVCITIIGQYRCVIRILDQQPNIQVRHIRYNDRVISSRNDGTTRREFDREAASMIETAKGLQHTSSTMK